LNTVFVIEFVLGLRIVPAYFGPVQRRMFLI
jgi:hypothetical protein